MILKELMLILLRIYKKAFSPWLPRACRFHPTCSEYMYQAIEKYGLMKGLLMGIKRIRHCHPWHAGGFDPVP